MSVSLVLLIVAFVLAILRAFGVLAPARELGWLALAFLALSFAVGGGAVLVLVFLILAVVLAVLAFFNVNLPFLSLGWAALASLILAFILGGGAAH